MSYISSYCPEKMFTYTFKFLHLFNCPLDRPKIALQSLFTRSALTVMSHIFFYYYIGFLWSDWFYFHPFPYLYIICTDVLTVHEGHRTSSCATYYSRSLICHLQFKSPAIQTIYRSPTPLISFIINFYSVEWNKKETVKVLT